MNIERKLIRAYKIRCGGIDNTGAEVLDGTRESVVLKVYYNGQSIPVCRHYDPKNYKCRANTNSSRRGQCRLRTFN